MQQAEAGRQQAHSALCRAHEPGGASSSNPSSMAMVRQNRISNLFRRPADSPPARQRRQRPRNRQLVSFVTQTVKIEA